MRGSKFKKEIQSWYYKDDFMFGNLWPAPLPLHFNITSRVMLRANSQWWTLKLSSRFLSKGWYHSMTRYIGKRSRNLGRYQQIIVRNMDDVCKQVMASNIELSIRAQGTDSLVWWHVFVTKQTPARLKGLQQYFNKLQLSTHWKLGT